MAEKQNVEIIPIGNLNGLVYTIDELYLPNEYGYAFGPITSHIKHDCSQVSYFTFSDIQMSSTIEY